jgi:membrane protein
MIVVMGFLMLVSLLLNALMDGLDDKLKQIFPSESIILFYIINIVLIFIFTTILFSVIYKTLPDGTVDWKDTLIGSTFTALLFMLGKSGIGFYLGNSSVATTYGAAGSLIVILLWVYYSALILYFGAEFTKAYAYSFGNKIIPNSYAVYVENKMIESEGAKTLKKKPEAKMKHAI